MSFFISCTYYTISKPLSKMAYLTCFAAIKMNTTTTLPDTSTGVSSQRISRSVVNFPWSDDDDDQKSSSFASCVKLVKDSSASLAPVVSSSSGNVTSSSPCCLAKVWREIQGCDDWEGLMEPLNSLLQEEIVRYGEFVKACYKAFELDANSRRYLHCKYGKNSMLKEVGMEDDGYEVTKYIYATPDICIPTQGGTCCSRWIGYVAVSSDEEVKRLGRRDILIAFRGTVTNTEWVANLMSSLTPARLDPHNPLPDVKVESGFLSLYTSDDSSCKFGVSSCREQLLSEVSRILNKYKGEEISMTLAGHSMGSSLALLFAYDISELGLNKSAKNNSKQIPVTVYSFGGPRVGNKAFKDRCEELGVKVLRIVNVNDPVTKLPGVFLNENFREVFGGKYQLPWSCSCYAHVGVELVLDFFKMENPSCVHDLETYISLLKQCPKTAQIQRDGVDFFNKAKEFFLSAQKLNSWPWLQVAERINLGSEEKVYVSKLLE